MSDIEIENGCTCGMNPTVRSWHLPHCPLRKLPTGAPLAEGQERQTARLLKRLILTATAKDAQQEDIEAVERQILALAASSAAAPVTQASDCRWCEHVKNGQRAHCPMHGFSATTKQVCRVVHVEGCDGECSERASSPAVLRGVSESHQNLRVAHARKQGAVDGFQQGWHAALKRIQQGDSAHDLRELLPLSASSPGSSDVLAVAEELERLYKLTPLVTIKGEDRVTLRKAVELLRASQGEARAPGSH